MWLLVCSLLIGQTGRGPENLGETEESNIGVEERVMEDSTLPQELPDAFYGLHCSLLLPSFYGLYASLSVLFRRFWKRFTSVPTARCLSRIAIRWPVPFFGFQDCRSGTGPGVPLGVG